MKLKEILNHIPVYQYLRLEDYLSIIAMGYPNSEDILRHINKTVGLVTIRNGTLTISVYGQ